MRVLPENPIPAPFDAIADVYDDTFSNSNVGQAQRLLIWRAIDRAFQPGQRILEINCGTGLDALHLAQRGVEVVACDSALGMIAVARRRLTSTPGVTVDVRSVPIEQISQLTAEGPFDGVLSNFSGLNCVPYLVPVARDLAKLVRPGGKVVVCVFGRCCLWEVAWYLARGDFHRAFRRFRREGVAATLSGGTTLTVHYPSAGALRRAFSPAFKCEYRTAVGITIPPSYAETLAERFPRLFRLAVKLDPFFGAMPGLRALADHVVLTFRRTSA